jgi:hypothetical protein
MAGFTQVFYTCYLGHRVCPAPIRYWHLYEPRLAGFDKGYPIPFHYFAPETPRHFIGDKELLNMFSCLYKCINLEATAQFISDRLEWWGYVCRWKNNIH